MCELLVGLGDVAVLEVSERGGRLRVRVETRGPRPGHPGCGGALVVKDRVEVAHADLPCFGRSTVLVWRKVRWSCPASGCSVGSFTKSAPQVAAARLAITDRAGRWATVQVGRHGRSVSEVAAQLVHGTRSWTPWPPTASR